MFDDIHRLRLIESYGTGIRRIFKLYENCPVQPSIEATTNAFKIVLPNMNASGAIAESTPEVSEKAPAAITPQMKTVMDYLAEYGEDRRRSAGAAEHQKDESLSTCTTDE